DERVARSRRDDAVLVIELRMLEARLAREGRLAQMKRNPGVALVAVPVAPVSLEGSKLGRNVLRRCLDLLHAEDIRRLAGDPLPDLRHPRPDPVDVPGGDLHRGALVSPRALPREDARARAGCPRSRAGHGMTPCPCPTDPLRATRRCRSGTRCRSSP